MTLRSSLDPLKITIIFLAGIIFLRLSHMNLSLFKRSIKSWGVNRSASFKVSVPLGDVLYEEPRPKPDRSIFLLDTTRVPRQKTNVLHNMVNLTARQACAVESAALHNPNLDVFLLFSAPTYRYDDNHSALTEPVIKALLSYKNVHLRQLNSVRFARGTPIQEWIKLGKIFTSSYTVEHFSYLLRFLTLYRYGGIYLDTDVVVLRSLEKLPLNFAGAEDTLSVATGVLGFEAYGLGHEIAEACLLDYRNYFSSYEWGNNGPGVMTRVLKKICRNDNISSIVANPKLCRGFRVMDSRSFYAVPFSDTAHFFEPIFLNKTLLRTRSSYLVHLWNDVSKTLIIERGSGTAYEALAKGNCPRVHTVMGEFF